MKTKVIHKEYIPLATLILLTITSVLTLTPLHTSAEDGSSNATDSTSADIGVNVGLACTLSGSNTSHAITLNNGNYNDNITGTTLHTICNGSGNYNIYAIGYTDSNNDGIGEDGNNTIHLAGSSNTINDIPTGTTLDGKVPNWAMKLAYTNGSGDSSIIQNGYNNFSIIPSTSTKVVEYNASTTNTTDSTVSTTYGVSISPNQPAGTYTGQVKYTMGYTPYIIPMQSATSADCGQELVDTRDGNLYTTAKINGLCWTTKNLDLPGGTTLSSADTNVPDNYSTAVAGFTDGNTLPQSSDSGFSDNATAYVYNSGSTTCSSDSPCYSYYSWRAATAGIAPSGGAVSGDICPRGWRLPTREEMTTLKDTYTTGITMTGSPFLGVYAGYYDSDDGMFNGGGLSGAYWSSNSLGGANAYKLGFYRSASAVYGDARHIGFSVRCVAKS